MNNQEPLAKYVATLEARERALRSARMKATYAGYRARQPEVAATVPATERRLRALAKANGLMLVKSRRRNPDALDFGRYVIVNDSRGNRVGRRGGQAAVSEFYRTGGMTLHEVRDELEAL